MTGATLSRRHSVTLIALVSLTAYSIDSCIPSIPLAVEALGAEPGIGQLTVGIYLAGYAVGQIPIGLLSDRYGRLPLLYGGLAVFLAGALVSAIATDIETLLAARFIQGIGGTVGPVTARAIARDIGAGKPLQRLLAIMVSALAIVTLLAPLLGSVLVQWFGWRATLVSNAILGVIATMLVLVNLQETAPRYDKNKHLGRQLLASVGKFFRCRQAIWATAVVSFAFFGYMAIVSSLASIIVEVYGISVLYVGPIFASCVVFYLGAALLSGRMSSSVGPYRLLQISSVFFCAGGLMCGAIALLGSVGLPMFCVALILFLLGLGFAFSSATATALAPLGEYAGFAAAILGTVQILFAAIGSTMAAMMYDGDIRSLALVLTLSSLACVTTIAFGSRLTIIE